MDRTTVIIAGLGIDLPVGFAVYLLWFATDFIWAPLYCGLFFFAVGLLIWAGAAIIPPRRQAAAPSLATSSSSRRRPE